MAAKKTKSKNNKVPSIVVMWKIDFDIAMLIYQRFTAIGMGDEEVSFLMGKPNTYVFNLINPAKKDKFKTEQLDILPTILDCGIRDIVPNDAKPKENIKLRAIRRIRPRKIIYEYAVVAPDGTGTKQAPIIKSLNTGDRKKLHPELHALTLQLLAEGHFDEPKNALELYLYYKEKLTAYFRPTDLQKSLATCLRKDKNAPASLIQYNLSARYVYQGNTKG
jgi:hypothetical protein